MTIPKVFPNFCVDAVLVLLIINDLFKRLHRNFIHFYLFYLSFFLIYFYHAVQIRNVNRMYTINETFISIEITLTI